MLNNVFRFRGVQVLSMQQPRPLHLLVAVRMFCVVEPQTSDFQMCGQVLFYLVFFFFSVGNSWIFPQPCFLVTTQSMMSRMLFVLFSGVSHQPPAILTTVLTKLRMSLCVMFLGLGGKVMKTGLRQRICFSWAGTTLDCQMSLCKQSSRGPQRRDYIHLQA